MNEFALHLGGLFVERRWRLPPPKQVATTLLCSDASAGWLSLVLLSQPSPAETPCSLDLSRPLGVGAFSGIAPSHDGAAVVQYLNGREGGMS